jgi:aminopeptidase
MLSNDLRRVDRIVELLVTYSCNAKKGDTIVVECIDTPPFVIERILNKICSLGAIPILIKKTQEALAEYAKHATEEAYKMLAEKELSIMKDANHFIGFRVPSAFDKFSEVPKDKMQNLLLYFIKPVHYEYRNKNLNWVYFRFPTSSMAIRAGMDNKTFEDYYYSAAFIDYERLARAMLPLESMLSTTKNVRIEGPGKTDVQFELSNYGICKSVCKNNIPDGEVFTAPVKTSVQGVIEFNVSSFYYGTLFSNVVLNFENGKVVSAAANDSKRLNELLNVDDGARYVGEFAFGLNPIITTPINDILFDEKMAGSVHFALGNAYPTADNGNKSSIHWDLILNQNSNAGGGCIYLDNRLVRRDGIFVIPELAPLNPN